MQRYAHLVPDPVKNLNEKGGSLLPDRMKGGRAATLVPSPSDIETDQAMLIQRRPYSLVDPN